MLELIVNNIKEGVVVTDTGGTILWVNPAFTTITGYSAEEAIGQNPRILKSDYHDHSFYKNLWDSILTDGFWEQEIWNRRKSGEVYPELLSIYALKDHRNITRYFVSIFTDLTDVKAKDRQLHNYLYVDPLTGLYNRNYFLKDLKSDVRMDQPRH
jgi:PAS domain S-box-containing protein